MPRPAAFPVTAVRRPPMHKLALLGVAIFAIVSAGCAPTPEVTAEGGSAARTLLAEQAAKGPVLAIVRGTALALAPAERDALVTRAMAQGVSGLSVRFTTEREDAVVRDPYLVVALDPASTEPATLACRRPDAVATAPSEGALRALAAFCKDGEIVGAARGEAQAPVVDRRQVERLLWRVAGGLFPDDYAETYGFGILPRGIDLGVGGSTGF
jgi:hypothetical protein